MGRPCIAVNPPAIVTSGVEGEAAARLTSTNCGDRVLAFACNPAQAWPTCAPASGTGEPAGSVEIPVPGKAVPIAGDHPGTIALTHDAPPQSDGALPAGLRGPGVIPGQDCGSGLNEGTVCAEGTSSVVATSADLGMPAILPPAPVGQEPAGRPDPSPGPSDLTKLISKYGVQLQSQAARILRDRQWAEDVVQEAFLRLSQEPALIASPGAWLRTVVHRLAVDRLRAERARQINEQAAAVARANQGSEIGPAEQIEFHELCRQVHGVLTQLPEDDRTVVWLRCYEGIGREQLAEQWGISANAVTKRETRAMRRLAKLLTKAGIHPCILLWPGLVEAAVRLEARGLHDWIGSPHQSAESIQTPAGNAHCGGGSLGPGSESLRGRPVGHPNPGWRSFSKHLPGYRHLLAAVSLLALIGVVTTSVHQPPQRQQTGPQAADRSIAQGAAKTGWQRAEARAFPAQVGGALGEAPWSIAEGIPPPATPQPGLGEPAFTAMPKAGPPEWPATRGWHLWECQTISRTPRIGTDAPGSKADTGPVCAMSCLCWSRTCVPLASAGEKAAGVDTGSLGLEALDRPPSQALLAVWGVPLQYPGRYRYTIVGDPARSAQMLGPVEVGFGCVLSPSPMAHALCFRDESLQEACVARLRQSSVPVLEELVLKQPSLGQGEAELLLDGFPAARWRPVPTSADQRLFVSAAGLAITVNEPTWSP